MTKFNTTVFLFLIGLTVNDGARMFQIAAEEPLKMGTQVLEYICSTVTFPT